MAMASFSGSPNSHSFPKPYFRFPQLQKLTPIKIPIIKGFIITTEMKFTPGLNAIAAISTCWGAFLTSASFVSIVWCSKPDVGMDADSTAVSLFCEALILTLGSIQVIFSLLLFLAPKHKKHSWTTIWICTHMIIVLSLVFVYILKSYVAIRHTKTEFHLELNTLDVVMYFDFLFLALFFLSLLWEFPSREDANERPVNNNGPQIWNNRTHSSSISNGNFEPITTLSSKVMNAQPCNSHVP